MNVAIQKRKAIVASHRDNDGLSSDILGKQRRHKETSDRTQHVEWRLCQNHDELHDCDRRRRKRQPAKHNL